jgi:signal transduction histidine kinase/ActR/RegA family two-component response regulator
MSPRYRAAILLLVACQALTPAGVRDRLQPGHRSVRIGVDQAAPYQSWVEGRGPIGFTVDVLGEAARKRGIHLEWIFCPEGPQKALRAGKVDLWPAQAVRAARDGGFYSTDPWLENTYAIIWRDTKPGSRDEEPDWRGRRIAVTNLPFGVRLAKQLLPGSTLELTPNRTVVFQLLCDGRADGGFMEVRLIEGLLLNRAPGCEDAGFRVRVVSDLRQTMATIATAPFRPEADALREEIGRMFQDGLFASSVDRWFVFSNIEAHSLVQLMEQRRMDTYGLVALAVMAILMILLAWMYRRARKATRSAKSANRAKDEFLANVSHEVRTPMNGVVGIAELLMETDLTPEQREYAGTIVESARLQLVILNDILDSAKIDSCKMTLEAIAFSPSDLLREVRRAFHLLAAQKGLRLELEIPAELPNVIGDPVRLRQVLSNLLNNALKFTFTGEIRVVAAAEREPGRATLVFSVADTGIGIEPAAQDRIFDKFTQADCSTTRHYGGTGLGLSISRSLVELMGGSIRVESTPGVGSKFTFRVTLPVVEAGIESVTPAPDIRQLTAAYPILVVEDNPVNQKVATAMLRSLGLSCESALDGQKGVEMCLSRKYSAVLMDCQMPGIDGFEATRRIRAALHSTLPIIALTAAVADSDRKRATDAGMNSFLSKPVRRSDLAELLVRVLDHPGPLPRTPKPD